VEEEAHTSRSTPVLKMKVPLKENPILLKMKQAMKQNLDVKVKNIMEKDAKVL